MVRIFKNIFSYINNSSLNRYSHISSHLIESLIYNVPNNYFLKNDIFERFEMILTYLEDDWKFKEMITPDNQNKLFDSHLKEYEVKKFLESVKEYM